MVKVIQKQQLATLRKHSLKIVLNNSNWFLPGTKLFTKNCLRSEFRAPLLPELKICSLFLHGAMYNYIKTQDSPNDLTKLTIQSISLPEIDLISNCGKIIERTVSFDFVVLFIDEEKVVTYVDFDMVSFQTLKLLQKLNKSTENGKTSAGSVKNPRASQLSINITVLLMKNKPLSAV